MDYRCPLGLELLEDEDEIICFSDGVAVVFGVGDDGLMLIRVIITLKIVRILQLHSVLLAGDYQ